MEGGCKDFGTAVAPPPSQRSGHPPGSSLSVVGADAGTAARKSFRPASFLQTVHLEDAGPPVSPPDIKF
ncbi:hypothetical protein FQA47_006422 [Oryzias melastigma]|uniref:Uncharacterized protein n=1 Tax=Oryzias melastigma TaxID=30732 RepID=A0A834CGE4_ORYME|nr:hypothetical protein FQA47_006422 [Oryzias melastigma]